LVVPWKQSLPGRIKQRFIVDDNVARNLFRDERDGAGRRIDHSRRREFARRERVPRCGSSSIPRARGSHLYNESSLDRPVDLESFAGHELDQLFSPALVISSSNIHGKHSTLAVAVTAAS